MSRLDRGRVWRDDRLADLIRRALDDPRSAAPSAAVWERIAGELSPPRTAWHHALRLPSLRATTMLSAGLLVILAVGSLRAELSPHAGPGRNAGRAAHTPGPVEGARYSGELSADERAIQPALERRPVDLTLPPVFDPPPSQRRPWVSGTPREAYNRALWLEPPVPAYGGSVTPLLALNGR